MSTEIATAPDEPIVAGLEGHIYVIDFGRTVKVGFTGQPEKRLSQHERDGHRFSVPVANSWFSGPHVQARANERALIAFCRRLSTGERQGGEYFAVPYDRVVSYAKTLPMTRGNREKYEADRHATVEGFKALTLHLQERRAREARIEQDPLVEASRVLGGLKGVIDKHTLDLAARQVLARAMGEVYSPLVDGPTHCPDDTAYASLATEFRRIADRLDSLDMRGLPTPYVSIRFGLSWGVGDSLERSRLAAEAVGEALRVTDFEVTEPDEDGRQTVSGSAQFSDCDSEYCEPAGVTHAQITVTSGVTPWSCLMKDNPEQFAQYVAWGQVPADDPALATP